ncbi:MAG: hypothetical protein K8S55_01625 [Phycisphaerae bacterium]|nr:hypothetical protein [Phycisphaerae bacterium]
MAGMKTKTNPGFFSQLAADESSAEKKTKKRTTKPAQNKKPARKPTARKATTAPQATRKRRTKPAAPPATQPTPEKTIPLGMISDPIAAKYDVRNITSLELTLMSNELYTTGRIGREELAMMSFQPELQSCCNKVDARDARPNSNQPRDTIAEWQGILEKQEEFKSSFFFVNLTRKVISLLESLDRARNGKR